jgi:hypothetical protein
MFAWNCDSGRGLWPVPPSLLLHCGLCLNASLTVLPPTKHVYSYAASFGGFQQGIFGLLFWHLSQVIERQEDTAGLPLPGSQGLLWSASLSEPTGTAYLHI